MYLLCYEVRYLEMNHIGLMVGAWGVYASFSLLYLCEV